jgi:type VI secretion system secreted protein Hcp
MRRAPSYVEHVGAFMNVRGVLLAGACVLTCALLSGHAQAAQTIYLEIPGVPGEVVTPAAFANQIEILSISSGASRPCGSGLISMGSINIMKMTDKATVKFSAAMRDHTVYAQATIRFVRSDGQVYQTYKMDNAIVETLQSSGSAGGDDRTTESVSFNYSALTVSYQFFDGAGKPSGALETMTFTNPSCP